MPTLPILEESLGGEQGEDEQETKSGLESKYHSHPSLVKNLSLYCIKLG